MSQFSPTPSVYIVPLSWLSVYGINVVRNSAVELHTVYIWWVWQLQQKFTSDACVMSDFMWGNCGVRLHVIRLYCTNHNQYVYWYSLVECTSICSLVLSHFFKFVSINRVSKAIKTNIFCSWRCWLACLYNSDCYAY